MANIIKQETEGKVLNMIADSSYIPRFKELREQGFEIPDLEFTFIFLQNDIIPDYVAIYAQFKGYADLHFIAGHGDLHDGRDFVFFIKEVALSTVWEYDFIQKELFADLDDADEIFETLGWSKEE